MGLGAASIHSTFAAYPPQFALQTFAGTPPTRECSGAVSALLMASDVMSTKRVVMKLGDAMWAGGVEGGRPHGTGDLILPNGSVHHGNFEAGRASGPGVFYDATGAVITGSWTDNKRVGPFTTIDPKGGEWADVYGADGKRTSRKKRAPPAAEAPGALKCTHCGVKFHAEHNSCCRQHSGKWMQSSEADAGEFPEGGIWLCCGSKVRVSVRVRVRVSG